MKYWVIIPLILVVFGPPAGQARSLRNLTVGERLPDFSLKDTGGNSFGFSDLLGGPAAIIYLKPGQNASEKLREDFTSWRGEFPDLKIVFISPDAAAVDVVPDSPAPTLIDDQKKVYGEWGVRVFPSFILMNSNGIVLKTDAGYGISDPEQLHNELRLLVTTGDLTPGRSDEGAPLTAEMDDQAVRYFQAGKKLWEEGLSDQAHLEWIASIEADSNYVSPRLSLARYFLKIGEIEQAEAHLEAALRSEETATMLILKARCRIRQNDLESAENILEDALDLNRRSFEAKLFLAEVYLLQDRIEESEAMIDEVMLLKKDHPRGYYLRGRIAEAQNRLKAAVENYRRAFDIMVSGQ